MKNNEEYGKYAVEISWDPEDEIWVALVPELPGCGAHGETREEALAEVQKAIADWIESAERRDCPVPAPLPTIAHIAKASKVLNKSELARLIGLDVRTFSARINNRTPLSREESIRMRDALKERGVMLM